MTDPGTSLPALETLAREALGTAAWDYLATTSGDGHTHRWNLAAWPALRLVPRNFVDVGSLDTRLSLLEHDLPAPVLLAPTAGHGLFHPDAEAATARGAALAGALWVASTLSTLTVRDIGAAATGPWWQQVYVQRDRDFTESLVRMAETAGATALVLTADLPLLATRDNDRRDGAGAAVGAVYGNLAGLDLAAVAATAHRSQNPHLDPSVTWDDVTWLRSVSSLPVVVKGVLRADEARRAVDHGAAAVVVSNHGGRALDTTPATADVLPSIVAAVGGRVPVLVDGGIRRGIDVAKALILGATAVLIGRPYVWGLSVGGADGVRDVADVLHRELETAMGLLGAPTLADLTRDLLWDRPAT